MILSLEKSAPGVNLVHAQHILFVHPMNYDSIDRAVSQRKQCIGRVKRLGQK